MDGCHAEIKPKTAGETENDLRAGCSHVIAHFQDPPLVSSPACRADGVGVLETAQRANRQLLQALAELQEPLSGRSTMSCCHRYVRECCSTAMSMTRVLLMQAPMLTH